MSNKLHQTDATATAYARSLLELATAQGAAESTGEELAAVQQIIEQNPVFGEYLADPAISASDRADALTRILKGRVSPLLYNFLGVLNHNGRMRKLGEVATAYGELLEEQLGNIEVDVTAAHKLTPEDLETIRKRVSDGLGKTAIVHPYVDESIIGGLIFRVQDRLIDASVRYQLQAMRQQLLSAAPK